MSKFVTKLFGGLFLAFADLPSIAHFSIDKLTTREERNRTYVDGEFTSNAKKEASMVSIVITWFDKNGKVVAKDDTYVSDLAPAETLPFEAYTKKNPEIFGMKLP